jgi:hypothetical protein
MAEHRYVDPWTLPLDLKPGDRARIPGRLDVEWDGSRAVPVCFEDDLAMSDYTEQGEPCCPFCRATAAGFERVAS